MRFDLDSLDRDDWQAMETLLAEGTAPDGAPFDPDVSPAARLVRWAAWGHFVVSWGFAPREPADADQPFD